MEKNKKEKLCKTIIADKKAGKMEKKETFV